MRGADAEPREVRSAGSARAEASLQLRGVAGGDAVGAVQREHLGQGVGADVHEAGRLPLGDDLFGAGASEGQTLEGLRVVGRREMVLPLGPVGQRVLTSEPGGVDRHQPGRSSWDQRASAVGASRSVHSRYRETIASKVPGAKGGSTASPTMNVGGLG